MKPLVLDDEASEEYRHALGTYASDSIAVANRFAERVDEAMERIAKEPHVWPLASGLRNISESENTGSIGSPTRCCSWSLRPKCGSSRSRMENGNPVTGCVACRASVNRRGAGVDLPVTGII